MLQLITFVHPITMEQVPYLPHGAIPQLCENYLPSPYWFPTPFVPWWKDKRLFVGRLTANERPIRVRNMLTKMEASFTVSIVQTVNRLIENKIPCLWPLFSIPPDINQQTLLSCPLLRFLEFPVEYSSCLV